MLSWGRFRAVVLMRLACVLTEVGQATRLTALAMSTTLVLLGPPALALDDVEVDLELILAVDISLSMDDEEQRLQRKRLRRSHSPSGGHRIYS